MADFLEAKVREIEERLAFLDNVGPMDRLQQGAAAEAMVAAANNPGGTAGEFMTAGLGLGLAGQMAGTMAGAAAPAAAPVAAPPPLPGAQTFHVEMGGQPSGPFTVAQIQAGVANGQVQATSLVWAAGMAGWVPASTVPALQPLFAAPPPLPPAAPPPVPPAAAPAPPTPPAQP